MRLRDGVGQAAPCRPSRADRGIDLVGEGVGDVAERAASGRIDGRERRTLLDPDAPISIRPVAGRSSRARGLETGYHAVSFLFPSWSGHQMIAAARSRLRTIAWVSR